MKRKTFIKSVAALPIIGATLKLDALSKLTEDWESTNSLPALFLGHGSPMNAIEENEFVRGFKAVGSKIEKPKAILCISAHWETKGTFVTAMEHPQTIHDFGGFPQELHDVQYPAPGSPELANTVAQIVTSTEVQMDHSWGLDHGSWTVVKQMYPNADVPVVQMSIDYSKPPIYHYELAKQLSELRKKGILIIGSGNMVHNLRMAAWDKMAVENYAFDWAVEASEKMKAWILENNHNPLINFENQGRAFNLSVPTPEHYLPLIYILGLKGHNDDVTLFNDKAIAGSLTMTSVKLG